MHLYKQKTEEAASRWRNIARWNRFGASGTKGTHPHSKLQDSPLLSSSGKWLYNAQNTIFNTNKRIIFNFLLLLLKYLIKSRNWCLTKWSGRSLMLQELLFKVKRICHKWAVSERLV